jgi:hypothetical protein
LPVKTSESASNTSISPDTSGQQVPAAATDPQRSQAQPPDHYLDKIESVIHAAAAKFDRAEAVVEVAVARTDSVKSLWTTVLGTFSQAAWAIFGLLAGVPREVWLVVAVIAAALMLGYLYRQIVLGRIREKKGSFQS